jgi:tRNA U54 and U55 pseudouridine synthase Pus10
MWERMQVEAEEKRKGYCCLVYCERVIAKEDLLQIEQASLEDSDEEGVPCLQVLIRSLLFYYFSFLCCLSCLIQITQKTPLRVMHRRSLLSRPKNIYSVKTTFLNNHYFLMELVTSAGKKYISCKFKSTFLFIGAYVKEFVHSDFGRTVPSVKSILNSRVRCFFGLLDVLDVIRLL